MFCVVFRGTGGTYDAWYDNVTGEYEKDTELQKVAADFIKNHCGAFDNLTVSGHSKGGNLSLYSAVNSEADIRNRITMAFSFDGPGFRTEFFENEAYEEMKNRLVTIISCNSTVGLMLRRAGKLAIVKTDTTGPLAHDTFKWEVMGPKFLKTTKLSKGSEKFDKVMDDILENMDEKTRVDFIDELFDTLLSSGAVTLTDLQDMTLIDKADLLIKVTKDKQVYAFIKNVIECMMR